MKIYKLIYQEIDTKDKLSEENRKVAFQHTLSDVELNALENDYKRSYIEYIKERLIGDMARAIELPEVTFENDDIE